jgi:hypothetical protein
MRLLAAGGLNDLYSQTCIDNDIPKLFSALNEKKHIKNWPADKFLMVDSGAHSWNKTTITKVNPQNARKKLPDINKFSNDYISFIESEKEKPFVFVELDCYGILSIEQLDDIYKQVQGIKGNFQYIRVYHPVLDGGDLSVLKKWINEGHGYIGLGNDSTYLLNKIFALTKDKIKYHGFAITKDEMCLKYPFYSCDSTTVLSVQKFGSCYEYRLYQLLKKDIINKRRVEAVIELNRRLVDGLIAFKKSELFYTNVWKKRGVEWKD